MENDLFRPIQEPKNQKEKKNLNAGKFKISDAAYWIQPISTSFLQHPNLFK